jgi:FkbM family methyltransferase
MNARPVKVGTYIIRVADDQPTFWAKVEAGLWEPATLAFIDAQVDETATFLDCGAWVGPTSLYAAFRARRVMAVEADPAALDQLRRNIAANPDLAGKITVVPRALHPTPGVAIMGARRKPGDSMSSLLLAGAERAWRVEAITPQELAAMLPRDGPLVVKIDLEGGEYRLLPHLGPILDRAAAVHLSLHPAFLLEAVDQDRATAQALSRAAVAPLKDFDGAPPEHGLPAGDWTLTRPRPAWKPPAA